jgi:hypothetical protein
MILAPLIVATLPVLHGLEAEDPGRARAALICCERVAESPMPYIRAAAWRDTLDISPWLVAIPGMLTMKRPGGVPFCSLVIAADTPGGYVALTEAAAAGFNTAGPLNVLVTVNTGIYVGGGLIIANFAAGSTVKLVNNGFILGSGGAGGNGPGGAGGDGGTALTLNANDLTIDNTNGRIFGGGGGGGGGGDYSSGSAGAQGGGGGGGFGYPGGAAGSPGGAGGAGAEGSAGTAGSRTAAGVHGLGGTDPFFGVSAGNGGDGGGIAAAGAAGGSSATTAGGPGGSAGKAILTNGVTVTWQGGNNATQVKGAIV